MISNLQIISAEILVIEKMIDDECWYEGERRHTYVPKDDKIVQQHIREIIMLVGHIIREETIKNIEENNNDTKWKRIRSL